jgi:hypothetical protein
MSSTEARETGAGNRNKEHVARALRGLLPASGLVLEVASGTGQHVAHFARCFPELSWQPTDADDGGFESIQAWTDREGLQNVQPPLRLDTREPDWPVDAAAAVLCLNMVHISPWASTEGLMAGAARLTGGNGPLILYGPFSVEGNHVADSNVAFNASLKARNPDWGVRDVRELGDLANRHGLTLLEQIPTPVNNFTLLFGRA